MNAIGGYPELELRKGEHYHKDAIRLNTARNCLEYILLARDYKKVYVPYYTCEAIHEPFKKPGILCDMEFYRINDRLDPLELPKLKEGEAFLYTNYFGLKQNTVEKLASLYGRRLIVDNSQAFYDTPHPGIDTFYSARKFFGVPDGAYLYTDTILKDYYGSEIEVDKSFDRMKALLKRIDLSAEDGYRDFQEVEGSLCNQPIRKMSKVTEAVLCSIDYERVKAIRLENYLMYDDNLSKQQRIFLNLESSAVPLCYPYYSKTAGLRNKLIENRIYVPCYWSNVLEYSGEGTVEYNCASYILPLPIDQRCQIFDIQRIIDVIKNKKHV